MQSNSHDLSGRGGQPGDDGPGVGERGKGDMPIERRQRQDPHYNGPERRVAKD